MASGCLGFGAPVSRTLCPPTAGHHDHPRAISPKLAIRQLGAGLWWTRVPVKRYRQREWLARLAELTRRRSRRPPGLEHRERIAMRNDLPYGRRDVPPELTRRCCRLLHEAIQRRIAAQQARSAGPRSGGLLDRPAIIWPTTFACLPLRRACTAGWPSGWTRWGKGYRAHEAECRCRARARRRIKIDDRHVGRSSSARSSKPASRMRLDIISDNKASSGQRHLENLRAEAAREPAHCRSTITRGGRREGSPAGKTPCGWPADRPHRSVGWHTGQRIRGRSAAGSRSADAGSFVMIYRTTGILNRASPANIRVAGFTAC